MAEPIRGPRAIVGIRRRTVEVATAAWEREWRTYFRGLERRFLAYARSHIRRAKGWKDEATADLDVDGFDWSGEETDLRRMLNQQYAAMTETVWTEVVGRQVGARMDFNLNARGVQRVLKRVATRVTMIDKASQEMIARRVAYEVSASSNADRLEAGLRDLLRSWGETGGRAHIIAMTESANAYNQAAVEGYRESGLVEEVEVYDGPDCGWTEHDDPDLADGSVRTLEEAQAYPEAHPHCQRAFGPVVLRE